MHRFTAGFLFSGLGAGARGFLESAARLGLHEGCFTALGGIDNDPLSCADFERLTGAPAVCADLSAMQPADLRAAWGDRAPDVIFTSPPCKGFSGLLSKASADKPQYQALNRLVLQGFFLACETWPEPPAMIVLENVPRIATRGAELLRQVRQLLAGYGYVFSEGYHDCGEIGGLAQHRRRFLMVARRPAAVPAFVYHPPRQRVRACGEVLGPLPLPEDPAAGDLHRLPRLSWINWVRLALIPAGGDWRDLPAARQPQSGNPLQHRNKFSLADWDGPAGAVIGATRPGSGAQSVADPRVTLAPADVRFSNKYKLRGWGDPAGTVTGDTDIQEGAQSIADPRVALAQTAAGASSFKGRPGLMGVNPWEEPLPTVTGSASVSGSNGVASVADPRLGHSPRPGSFGVTPWSAPASTVRGVSKAQNGGAAVADPRVTLGCAPRNGSYGVVGWGKPAGTVTGSAQIDNGPVAVADPRIPECYRLLTVEEALTEADRAKTPAAGVVPVILSPHDGTWHRPLTTLELAVLQGLPEQLDGAPLALAGRSVAGYRERIGNAVPVGAGRAIGDALLLALLASRLRTWTLGSTGIWVRQDLPEGPKRLGAGDAL